MGLLGSSTIPLGVGMGGVVGEHCWEWGRKYLEFEVCSVKDGMSLALGVISVLSWGVAEVPQIITNYKAKCSHGLSLAFLITWIIGDLFNLFGCLLEPATLPTQYYTAIMVFDRILNLHSAVIYLIFVVDNRDHVIGYLFSWKFIRSARSLSRSHTPSEGFHAAQRTTLPFNRNRNPNEEPLLGALASTQSAPSSNVKTTLCVVSLMTLFCTFNQRSVDLSVDNPNRGVVMQVGRRLLQGNSGLLREMGTKHSSGIGTFLGWGMAVIYIGGRFPQIYLNIRKGNVDGLNPFMFIFAVVGNAAYVASILVNSMEWSKISPNLAWLVDAGGCMLLDIFILLQFFQYWRRRNVGGKDRHSNAA
ncbi:vacuolar arginine/histidine antiporter stm1-like [Pyrus communis]|uniref:vacuolar arginine/histidine antiporter stm1-like n=1 Tax=Pyrus communis TaxID=23211 RepID=UPI0035BFF056